MVLLCHGIVQGVLPGLPYGYSTLIVKEMESIEAITRL